MPASRFTNVPQNGFTPSWTSTSRQYAPYAAKGKFTNLTEKERLARRIRTSNMSGAGGYGGPSPMGGGSNTALSGNSSFFSPQLSTDFLELPQSLREKREIYRHFYNSDPLVGQAIDLHTELPLSKVRLSTPKPQHCPPEFKNADNYGKYILDFFERMCDKIDLFKRLLTLTHHYWLDGNCVSGDVLVSTRSGEVPIKQVLVGDEVLTNKGRWKSVEAVMQRESEGLIAIKVSRLPDTIDVTSEHPMETLRGDSWKFVLASEVKKGDYLRVTWPTITSDLVSIDLLKGVPGVKLATKNSYSIIRKCSHLRDEQAVRARSKLLSWLSSLESPTIRTRKSLAKEFGVDLPTLNNVIITLDSEFGSGYHKRIGPVGFSKGSQTVWYPTNEVRCSSEHYTISREYYFSAKPSIQVDQDFLYLVGYWLGDGTLSRDSKRMSWGRGIWNICFGRDSRPQYTRVKEILTNKLGADCIRESVDSVGMRTIYVKHHPAFIEWWSTQFGGTSHGLNPKRVPAWVSQLPADKTLAFIAGIVDSDGCVSVSKCKKGIVSIGLTSRNLIFSIRDLLLRVGVVPSLRVSDTKDGLIGSQVIKANHQVYYLTVESREQCCLVTSMSLKGKNIRPDTKFVKGHPSYKVLADGTVGFLVSDVSNISSGTVYNLQVSDDSTFRAGFVSTHNCFIFAEDSSVDIPVDVGHKVERRPMAILNEDGTGTETDEEVVEPYSDHEERDLAYYQKHYKGWSKLVILPIDQVKLTTFSFTDKVRIELIPSDRDKVLFTQAKAGDERAQEMVEEIPAEVREYIESGKLIPLGTDADEGSFCYHLAARRGAGEDLGASILDRCLRTLYYREKLRQAQTLIASRAMTPKRLIWGEGLSEIDVEDLREQVDLALVDPDYSIITNYEVHWEDIGARDRLLDLSTEYEITDKQLFAGLGVTESLLNGESTFSGDRVKLEVLNTRYVLFREMIQEYVEKYLFRPVARRKGFVEQDEWGNEVVLYPRLSFTRLALRDSQDTYDALFNLYQKGSLSIDVILELFNIDPMDTKEKLEKDMFTINDSTFNEVLRGIYGEVGRKLVEDTNVAQKISDYLNLKKNEAPPAESETRFG